MGPKSEDLKPLTSLRFLAALLVFIYHAPMWQPFARDHALGQVGVGFFFLLSGFILTYTYAPKVALGRFDTRAFYVARVARIYPTYLASIAIALAVVTVYGGAVFWSASPPFTRGVAVATQVLSVQAWFPSEQIYFGPNPPAWSISVEAFFYALFPAVIRSLMRSFAAYSNRVIFLSAAVTWGCVAAVFSLPYRVDVWTTYVFPPVRIVDFLVGMLLGLAFLRGYRLRGPATAWEVGAVLAIGIGIVDPPAVPEALRYSLLFMPLWAALIAIVALCRGALSWVLSHWISVRLGEISFAFYLVHLSVLNVAQKVVSPPLIAPAALVASLSLAVALNVLVERPMRTWVRIIGQSPPVDRAAA